ncbi:MAG: hypothetical protein V1888_02550 [archaeon]
MSNNTRAGTLKEAISRVDFLEKNSDLAKVKVGEGEICRKKTFFYPNGFGLMAFLFEESYNEVPYKDGYRNHAFPGWKNQPGYFSYMGFRNMLESRFSIGTVSIKKGSIVTIGRYIEEFNGSEEDAKKELGKDAFKRFESSDAFLYLGDVGLSSIKVFGVNPYEKKFMNLIVDTTKIKDKADYFYHVLK